ncbi:hypothetical protein A6R68_09305, partial [Neotoma lepida]
MGSGAGAQGCGPGPRTERLGCSAKGILTSWSQSALANSVSQESVESVVKILDIGENMCKMLLILNGSTLGSAPGGRSEMVYEGRQLLADGLHLRIDAVEQLMLPNAAVVVLLIHQSEQNSQMSGNADVLEYYKNEHSKKPLWIINLNCEQVDTGLTFNKKELHDNFVFDIKISEHTFYLVAETEADMNNWVQSICQACGFT